MDHIVMTDKPKDIALIPPEDPKEVEDWDINDEDEEWCNMMLRPDKPLTNRHREVARLLAHGKKQVDICRLLGYSQGRMSLLCNSPKILKESERIRDKLFAVDLDHRMKELSCDAMDVVEEILMSPNVSVKEKESAARWVLEKTTGKPAQQVQHTHEGSIGMFIDRLDNQSNKAALGIQDRGNPQPIKEGDIIDVEPKEPEEPQDAFSAWLDKNLDS